MSVGGGSTNPNDQLKLGEEYSQSSEASAGSRDPSTVWGTQAGFLGDLYRQAQQMQGQFGQYQDKAQGVFDNALGGFQSMLNPGMNPELQAYQGDVQRNFQNNILPTINSQAQGFGSLGNSRQGIAQGLAAGQANQQVTDMAANLYNDDRNRMMQAIQQAPALGGFGMSIPWYGLQQYAGILGRPTVLAGGSEQSASGSSSGYGYDYGRDTGGGSWNGKVGLW